MHPGRLFFFAACLSHPRRTPIVRREACLAPEQHNIPVLSYPKYRRKVLTGTVELRLKELIYEAAAEINVDIIEMEIMPDHVHLLMEVDPQFGIHRAVKAIKGKTSRVLRSEFASLRSRLPSLWTNSYFVSTVGGAPLSAIKQYIENQKNI